MGPVQLCLRVQVEGEGVRLPGRGASQPLVRLTHGVAVDGHQVVEAASVDERARDQLSADEDDRLLAYL